MQMSGKGEAEGFVGDRVPVSFGKSGELTIACYENHIPPFVEAEMEQLYENVFASMLQFRTYHGAPAGSHAYVARKDGKAITILLFQIRNGTARVMNEVIWLSEQEIRRFADYVFGTFKTVNVILFSAIETDTGMLPYPHQRFNFLEDIVASLPDTVDEYLARLGKNTRRNIKRYMHRLKLRFPSFGYKVYVRDEVSEDDIRAVIALNHARMAEKHKISGIDEPETQRIIKMVKECGLVCIASIDGRICAGTISFRMGRNYFLSVIAHDPPYDHFWIGILCCYLTLCEYIARGGKSCHFLWGQYEYKYALLGVQRDLDNVAVYRSRAHMLLNGGQVLQSIASGLRRKTNLWLHKVKREDGMLAHAAARVLDFLRNLRRPTARDITYRRNE